MDRDKFLVAIAAVGVAGVIYYSSQKNKTSVTMPDASPYQLHPNTAVALGAGQSSYGSTANVLSPYPSDAFDTIFENSFGDSQQAKYNTSLFNNLQLNQGAMGLPVFTGDVDGPNQVVVYDPSTDSTYNWDPATNSVVSA